MPLKRLARLPARGRGGLTVNSVDGTLLILVAIFTIPPLSTFLRFSIRIHIIKDGSTAPERSSSKLGHRNDGARVLAFRLSAGIPYSSVRGRVECGVKVVPAVGPDTEQSTSRVEASLEA
jgi:hypothetical protein